VFPKSRPHAGTFWLPQEREKKRVNFTMKKAVSRKIIYCDASEKQQEVFGRELRKFDPQKKVTCVASCEELLYILYKHYIKPFLIFMHTELPRKNGVACLEEIKSNEQFKNLPVIMVGPDNVELINECYNKGAAFYILQPFDENGFQNIFEKIFSQKWKNEDFKKRNKNAFVIQSADNK
jgi:CheY-like chemotaxis protein